MLDRGTFLAGLVAVILPPPPAPLKLDLKRPVNIKIRVLDGPDFQLDKHLGSVVFLTFFATWCGPCQMEQPEFVAFAAAHRDDTVVVAVDSDESDDTVRAWRKKYAIPYPIAMDEKGLYQETLAPKVIFPTTIVFDPNGFVSDWWYHTADRDDLEAARTKALAAVTPAASPDPATSAAPA
jgi:thiol-disulfide isomerase/thioredoxin